MSKKESLENTLPTHPDGSGDLMGIYRKTFEQCSKESEVKIVEGSLETLYRLVNQPYFAQALDREVNVQILYTGPDPSSDKEKRMLQSIADFQIQRTINSLSPNDRMELMQRDMFGVYQKKGLEGLAQHLTQAFRKNGHAMEYDIAIKIAQGFEEDVKAGRIAY